MAYSINEETFDSLTNYWFDPDSPLNWDCLFVLPAWLRVWWGEFGDDSELYLRSIKKGDDLIGIAPLLLKGESASFIGSHDVCDFQDFIISPGCEQEFFEVLLENLYQRGITGLDLRSLRPESSVLKHLIDEARNREYEVSCDPDNVSLELNLPSTWDGYLQILKGKQRHEVKRKLRRLNEAGDINYRIVEELDGVKDVMNTFFSLFRESRSDKDAFMNPEMESFFKSLAFAMAEIKILRFYILELDGRTIAVVMCFDYNDTIYLCNNGYDPQFNSLSVGVISKVLIIKDSIKRGKKKYDFLKGAETYKRRLGGQEIPLSRCQIRLK